MWSCDSEPRGRSRPREHSRQKEQTRQTPGGGKELHRTEAGKAKQGLQEGGGAGACV